MYINLSLNNHLKQSNTYSFITGGSGFVGSFLIHSILTNPNNHCLILVRCLNNEELGLEKVKKSLRKYNLWRDDYADRIKVIPGNLTQEYLGVDTQTWSRYKINSIYHLAFKIDWVSSLEDLYRINVAPIDDVINLAKLHPRITVNFLSSLGIYDPLTENPDEKINYDKTLPEYINGYSVSKYRAESKLWNASRDGLNINIFRSANLQFFKFKEPPIHSRSFEMFLATCFMIKKIPDHNHFVYDLMPVELISDFLVHINNNPCPSNFNVYNMMANNWFDLQNSLKDYLTTKYDLRPVPPTQWVEECRKHKYLPIFPLLDIIQIDKVVCYDVPTSSFDEASKFSVESYLRGNLSSIIAYIDRIYRRATHLNSV